MDDIDIVADDSFEAAELRSESECGGVVSDVQDVGDAQWCYAPREGIRCSINVRFGSGINTTNQGRSYIISVLPRDCTSGWEVERSYQEFTDLQEYLRTSVTLCALSEFLPALPAAVEEDFSSFSNFLEKILLHVGDYIWNCPRILSFLDNALKVPSIRDSHLSVLTEEIRSLTVAYRELQMKLYDAQDTWDDISERLMRLESSHLQEGAAYEEVSTEFVERNYEDSIAIYNESYAAALDNYISPNEMDAGLLPAGMPSGGLDVEIVTPFEKRDTFLTSENEEAEELVTDDEAVASNPSFAVAHTASPLPAIPEEIEVFEATVDMIPMLGCKSMSSLLPGTPLESLASIALDSPGKVTLLIPGPTDKFDISSTAAGKDLNIFSSIETNIMERNIPESPKSDVDQIRDIGATVVPTACPVPVPPRIHSYKSCKYQRIVSILESEVSSACDVAVDAVLSLLMPHEVQITYRTSARAYLDRAVRLSLNAKIFESGLHALQTFLPDDPVRLTVLLWRGNSTNWLANLTDKMRTLENAGGSAGSKSLPGSMGGMMMNGMPSFDDDAFGENNFDVDNEPKPTGEHTVSGINPSTNNGHSRLLLNIDSVPVEIMPNGRSDLCFLALVEEIAQLVGKNELFKRSLLLIRGWWTYETSAYVGVSTKNFLSDSVVSVLVCSIFNQYHAVINQPLQALAVFLAEYSDVKWSDVAVTLQGIVPFHSSSVIDNQPWLREPLPSELVSSAILQKHCDFYHMSSTSTSRASSTPAIAVVEVESDTKDTASSSGTTTVSTTPRALLDAVRRETMIPTFAAIPLGSPASSAPPTPGTATPSDPGSASTAATVAAAAAQLSVKEPSAPSTKRTPSDSHCYSPTAVRNFQKRIINVVHPLTNANMISTSMSSDRMGRISQILDMGASDLSSALEGALKISPGEENGICTVQTHFNSFFRGILGRFSGGWRPDIFHNLAAEDSSSSRPGFFSKLADTKSGPIFKGVALSDLFDQIRYMDLVLVGRVSESALLALSLDILVGRGVLPVGEIGKSLQDIAPTRNLSGKIKEKYGGLKKFLERYPEDVVICADHPFNPHVFLRKPLNRGDLELIAKGIIPPHLRKAMALRNKMRGSGVSGPLDGHNANYPLGPQGMGGHGPLRHMNPNMERNLNAAAAAGGLLNYGIQGHEQAMNIRINQQMQQQAFKAQQQASAQQQMYLHQHAQEGHGHGHGQGPYRGQESSIHHPSQYFNQAPAMREADSQMMTRNFMAEQMMRASPQLGSQMGSIGSGLGQDYASGSQNRRNVGIIPMGSDLNLNPSISESYSAFSVRRSLSDSSHNLLGGSEGVGARNLNTFGTALDGGQMRRYNDLSLGGALGLGSESGHERGNNVYDLSNGQDRPPERRFSEVFREHSESTSRDSLGTPGFGHSLSLNNSSHSSRRPSVSMQLAAKSFSERDKVERDRSLGIESWSEPTFSLDRGDCMDDRLRDRDSRYGENDFNIEVNSELFTSAALGGSSNQMLGEESTSEFYDQRGQGLGRGYQQSLARDSYQSQGGQGLLGQGQNHSKTASSLFLQQRDDDLMYEQEYSIRDRQHQLQTLALQRQDDEEQHQRLILQNQQAGVQRLAFRPPQNIFDPKKWIQ